MSELKTHLIPVEKIATALEFERKQMHSYWLPTEPKVEKDIHEIRALSNEAEKHGIITVLKLFSLYETHAGSEYWGGRFKEIFKDDGDMHRLSACFSFVELCVHQPFYNKINQLLNLDNEAFYLSYQKVDVLRERMEFIGDCIDHKNDLISLGAFSMIEGGILYSNFAFLKSFQSNRHGKYKAIGSGINFSLKDENLHSMAGAWAYDFKKNRDHTTKEELAFVESTLVNVAKKIYEHESLIIDMIFEKGELDNINAVDLKEFVKSRLNACLSQLNIAPVFVVGDNPVAEWFYDSIGNLSFNDFFATIGHAYHRNWSDDDFKWKSEAERKNNPLFN